MLIDNGDLIQGNPMGDYIAYEKGMKDGDVHPIITGMNTLGYECSTLGNHEFNYGLDVPRQGARRRQFPVRLRQSGQGHDARRRSAQGQALCSSPTSSSTRR